MMNNLLYLGNILPRALLQTQIPLVYEYRSTSFFVKLTAEQLWKGVTSVSNAGRKRGRASGHARKMSKNLNRGQIIGVGKVNMVWPGLNAPVIKGRELVTRVERPPDTELAQRILALRNQTVGFKPIKLNPLERGWSGTKMGGRSIGPPDPIGSETFEGFDSRVIELRMVCSMRGNLGRTRTHKASVVVGNGKGLVGIASSKSPDVRSAMRKAKNRAVQRLRYIERFEEHTILHDMFCEYGTTKVIVRKRPQGHGLVCHRVIAEICKMIGIKDLYAKLDCRQPATINVARAFLLGLQAQRNHQQLANEMGLHVVEFRKETDNFPKVIASPENGTVKTEPLSDEKTFDLVLFDGKVWREKAKKEPFYTRLPSWQVRLKKIDNIRNERAVRLHLFKRYGKLTSFLNEKFEAESKENALKDAEAESNASA